MTRHTTTTAFLCVAIAASVAMAQTGQPVASPASRVALGRLANDATVTFVRAGSEDWGLDISGPARPHLAQARPAQAEIYCADDTVQQLAVCYRSLRKEAGAVVATATAAGQGGASFIVEDRWTLTGAVVSLRRTVRVTGTEPRAGFTSDIRLATDPTLSWADADHLAPGLFYGEPHTTA